MLNESSSNTNQISQEREKRKQQLLADGGNGLERGVTAAFLGRFDLYLGLVSRQ